MRKYADLIVTTGEYIDRSGQQKKSFARIGTMFEDERSGKLSIKLDVLPLPRIGNSGAAECWISVMRDDGKNQSNSEPYQRGRAAEDRPPRNRPPVNESHPF